MPNTKQFEAFDINDIIFGGEPQMLSMKEISKIYYIRIKEIYNYLEDDKTASIEVPEHECMYYLKRINSHLFELKTNGNDLFPKTEMTSIETVNWLFRIAPFMAMVGYSNI